jgi:hypothetical protein
MQRRIAVNVLDVCKPAICLKSSNYIVRIAIRNRCQKSSFFFRRGFAAHAAFGAIPIMPLVSDRAAPAALAAAPIMPLVSDRAAPAALAATPLVNAKDACDWFHELRPNLGDGSSNSRCCLLSTWFPELRLIEGPGGDRRLELTSQYLGCTS